jgi:hypothetical protein
LVDNDDEETSAEDNDNGDDEDDHLMEFEERKVVEGEADRVATTASKKK